MALQLDNRPGSEYDDDWKPPTGNTDELEDAYNAPSASDEDLPEGHPSRSSSSPELKKAEESGGETQASSDAANEEMADLSEDGLYKEDAKPKSRGFVSRWSARKRVLVGGVLGVSVGSGLLVMVLILPLLRLESYIKRIEQRAFALAIDAVEARSERLFDKYMIRHITNLESCGSRRSVDCKANYANAGLASGLFNTWRDVKAEEKILDRLGFTIESTDNPNGAAGVHKFTLKDAAGRKITFTGIDDWDRFKSGQFTGGDRVLGREIRKAMRDEFKLREVMQRRSVRKYLQRKHGIRVWCFFACKTRDNIDLKITDVKTRYKLKFVERFIYPMSPKYGFVMNCIMQGGDCKPSDTQKILLDRSKLTESDIEEIVADFKTEDGNFRSDRKLVTYGIERILTKILNKEMARTAVGAIPVAGQIYLGAWAFDMAYRVDDFVGNNGLSQMAASINSSQYIEFYTGMKTINDEMKSHNLSMEEVGVVMNDFQGAEESKLYQAHYGNSGSSPLSLLLGSTTYAQSTDSTSSEKEPYLCEDSQAVDHDDYVCDEKKVARTYLIEDLRTSRVGQGLSDSLFGTYSYCLATCRLSVKYVVQSALDTVDAVSEIAEPVIRVGLAALGLVPGIGQLMATMVDAVTSIFQYLYKTVFPLVLDVDSQSREKYDGLVAGAELVASEYGKGGYTESAESYGLGAPALSDQEVKLILKDYYLAQEADYKNAGIIEKITTLEYPNSFANNLIAAFPSKPNQAPERILSNLASVFSNVSSLFMNVFSSWLPAHAATNSPRDINAFGITRYGYPINDPSFNREPEELTPEFCESVRAERESTKTIDPTTGFEVYTIADPCLLEEAVVEAAGAYFTND